jgi:ABC-type glycerol-3-phosphate transport system substrate-binding protein
MTTDTHTGSAPRFQGSTRRRRAVLGVLVLGGGAGALSAACAVGESPAPAPGQRETTLVFDTDWLSGARGDVVDRALRLWSERYPKIRIDKRDVLTQAGTVFEKTATLIASDSLGDVMLWAGYIFVYYAKRGLFVDVGPYLKKYKVSLDDRYIIPEHIIYEGKTYGFPWQFNAVDYIYNKSLFASHGVKATDESLTWETLVEAATHLTNADNSVFGLAPPGYWRELLWSNGGEERSKDDTKTTLDTPQAIEAVTYAAELATRLRIAPTPLQASPQQQNLSPQNGNFAVWLGGASRGLDQRIAGKFEWDLMYAPKWAKTGKRFVEQNDQPHVITGSAKKHDAVEEAALFGAFMSGEEVQGFVAKYGDTCPVFKKAADSDDFLPASKWNRKVLVDGFAYRRYNQGIEYWWAWSRVVEAEINKALNGQASPRDACMAATRAGDAALAAKSLQPPAS